MRQRRVKMMTILDALRHVKPVEIVVHQLRQAAVNLPRTSQNAGLRDAAFITRCSLLVMTFGAPARATLQ